MRTCNVLAVSPTVPKRLMSSNCRHRGVRSRNGGESVVGWCLVRAQKCAGHWRYRYLVGPLVLTGFTLKHLRLQEFAALLLAETSQHRLPPLRALSRPDFLFSRMRGT